MATARAGGCMPCYEPVIGPDLNVGGRSFSTICSVNRLVCSVLGMPSFLPGERWGSRNTRFPAEPVGTVSASNIEERQSTACPEGYRLGRVGTEERALAKVGVVSSNLIARSKFP
jgi:hypothetical protein